MNFWKILGRDKPSANQAQRAFYTKAFQRLWVAGTMGAYFTALAHSLPETITRLSQGRLPFDDVAVICLSYGYLLWLLFYFLTSATNNDHPAAGRGGWDVAFDVTQSVGGLIAAFYLGFAGSPPRRGVTPYLVTNIVIFLICAASRYLFSSTRKGVNRLREIGAVIALIAFLLCIILDFGRGLIISLAVCQTLLVILLGFYSWICFNEQPPETVPISATGALATASAATANAATALATASAAVANAASHAAKADQAISDATQSLAKAHNELN